MDINCTVDKGAFRSQLKAACPDMEYGREVTEYVSRSYVQIPDTFVPSARGIAIGSALFQWFADATYKPMYEASRRNRPRGWVGSVRDGRFLSRPISGLLSVQKYGKLWAIERKGKQDEVLAFSFGPTPVFFDYHRIPITLSQYCHPNPPKDLQCLSWVPISA